MHKRINGIVTYETYQNELNKIESNLKDNIIQARIIVEDFEKNHDAGNMTDIAYLFIIKQNLSQLKNALNDFLKLPLID